MAEEMANVELFLDESGYTGPDLIDVEQPVFTLASTTSARQRRDLSWSLASGNGKPN
jgi:hypothetical protein